MSNEELNTLQHICELERTQLLTTLALSVQNPQLPGTIFQQETVVISFM